MSKRKSFPAIFFLILLMALSCDIAFAGTGNVTTEDSYTERGDLRIFGRLYLPEDSDTQIPLVILSHGLGSNHEIMEPYAQSFAEHGIAAFVFDFIGGSEVSLSDGSMTQMSVLTEAEDLSCILDRFLDDSRFAQDQIFLFGGSQGGFVSAYVAGERPEDVAGLVLLYPAFNLQEISCELISKYGEIPETVTIGEHTADPLVPLEYSERAVEVLEDAELAAEKRKALMNIYRPGLLLVPKEFRGSFMAMKEILEFGDYILLKTNYRDCFPVHPQLGQLITTSGSTGSAKFVRQSKENLRFNAAA